MSEKSKLLRQEFEEEKTSSKRYGSVSYKYTLIDSVPKWVLVFSFELLYKIRNNKMWSDFWIKNDLLFRTHFTKKQCVLVSIALLVVITAFSVTLILGLPKLREKRNEYLKGAFIASDAEEAVFSEAAIVVDGQPCAQIGKDVAWQIIYLS